MVAGLGGVASVLVIRTLLFDGDDTLWANSHHFEAAMVRWAELVCAPGVAMPEGAPGVPAGGWTHAAARAELNRVEAANFHNAIGTFGFADNLRVAAATIVRPEALAAIHTQCANLVAAMPTTDAEAFPEVPAVLDALGERFVLGLVTRGDPTEQHAKLASSGLGDRFRHVAVVPAKNAETYAGLARDWGLDPAATVMIGNSPRSDIEPALAAGMGAVLVSHGETWHLEVVDLDHLGDAFHSISRFEDLLTLFP